MGGCLDQYIEHGGLSGLNRPIESGFDLTGIFYPFTISTKSFRNFGIVRIA